MRDRTKWDLCRALETLLKTRSIEQITIQDIVDVSGFNRQTFYYHFHDIYEMMGWWMDQTLKKATKSMPKDLPSEELLRIIFDVVRSRADIIIHAYNPDYKREYENMIQPWIKMAIGTAIRRHEGSDEISEDSIVFMVDTFTFVFLGITFKWLEEGLPDRTDRILHNYFTVFAASVDSSIKAFAKEKSNSTL